jgi:hypothetical protein
MHFAEVIRAGIFWNWKALARTSAQDKICLAWLGDAIKFVVTAKWLREPNPEKSAAIGVASCR